MGEYESIDYVHELAFFIEQHGKIGAELLSHFGGDLEDTGKAIEDHYAGCYKSLSDYAAELTESTVQIPESIQFYIDYERMARDMEMSGDIYTIELAHDEVHIFWSH